MRETITTARTWVITKASRLKVVLSWTKTIWAMVRFMGETRQSTWKSVRRSMRVQARRNIKELIMIWVSSILNTPPLNSRTPEAKLIEVTSTETKHANKRFLSQLAGFFPYFFLWVGWVVSFGGFDYRFLLVVGGAGNKLGSTLLTLILTPLKPKTQSVYGLGCTLLNPAQILLNHFLVQNSFLKTCSQISDFLL
jgi:hypothetical protein